MRRKRCDCEGGLGGDGWATDKWKGDLVCKECKKRDQINTYLFESNKGRLEGERKGSSKLTRDQVLKIKERLKFKDYHENIAKDYGVTAKAISAINTGRTWKNL